MKGVLVSIQPKWCRLIADKKKVVEVRKTRPKSKTPFKCYIYATQPKKKFDLGLCFTEYGKIDFVSKINYELAKRYNIEIISGKVIGEFVCDRIDRIGKRGINNNFDYCYLSLNEWGNDDVEIEITDIQKSCISKSELNAYGANSSCLYAWHITDLKIYDKPKELSEFKTICRSAYCQDDYGTPTWFCKDGYGSCAVKDKEKEYPYNDECIYFDCPCYGENCEYEDYAYCNCNGLKPVTRPPQSWCYVEVDK